MRRRTMIIVVELLFWLLIIMLLVIYINAKGEGKFVTAYLVDNQVQPTRLQVALSGKKVHKKTTGYLAQ